MCAELSLYVHSCSRAKALAADRREDALDEVVSTGQVPTLPERCGQSFCDLAHSCMCVSRRVAFVHDVCSICLMILTCENRIGWQCCHVWKLARQATMEIVDCDQESRVTMDYITIATGRRRTKKGLDHQQV